MMILSGHGLSNSRTLIKRTWDKAQANMRQYGRRYERILRFISSTRSRNLVGRRLHRHEFELVRQRLHDVVDEAPQPKLLIENSAGVNDADRSCCQSELG